MFRPVFTLGHIAYWRKEVSGLASLADKLDLFNRFADIEDAFEPLERLLNEIARLIDSATKSRDSSTARSNAPSILLVANDTSDPCRPASTAGPRPRETSPRIHPLPQALGTGEYPLPKGDVCQSCNPYLSDLDHTLCDHHHLASMIVFGNLPGTDDRIRRTVARGLAFDADRQHLTVRARESQVEPGRLTLRDPGNVKFDPWKFSRGLHRVALGLLAWRAGAALALEGRFDSVRRYIRQPVSRQTFWPYSQRVTDKILGNRTFPPALRRQGFKFGFAIGDTATYVYMNLFVDEFIVALHGDVRSMSDVEKQQFALAAGLEESQLSGRPWLLFEDPKAGREITVTPEWFANAKLGDTSAPIPDELPHTDDEADTDDHR